MTKLDAIFLLKAFYSLSWTAKLTKEILDGACICFDLKGSTSILSLAKEFIVKKYVEIRGSLPFTDTSVIVVRQLGKELVSDNDDTQSFSGFD